MSLPPVDVVAPAPDVESSHSGKDSFLVLLSGLPCTGKSTWRDTFVKAFRSAGLNREISIISADDTAVELCQALNSLYPFPGPYSYNTIMDPHYPEVERICAARLKNAAAQGHVVVIDRTLLTPARRKAVLEDAHAYYQSSKVFCVSFIVNDDDLHLQGLVNRNKTQPSKIIDEELLERMKLQPERSAPVKEEGFHRLFTCPCVQEPGWKEAHVYSVWEIIGQLKEDLDGVFESSPHIENHREAQGPVSKT